MRKIISNTTPLISLLKIDKLNLFKDLYGKIIIPKAVFQEFENGKHKDYYQEINKIDWIEVQNITNTESVSYFFDLDEGEAQVLILAHELNADLVIIDELAGRRYAKNLGLKLTGTLGILLKAKEKGLISNVKDSLEGLIDKGSWIDKELIVKVLRLANE